MNSLRPFTVAAVVLCLSACGGSGGGNLFGGVPTTTYCQTGTAEQVASPTPNQITSNVNQIIIVASGNTDAIYSNPQSWSVFVTATNGGYSIQGGALNLVPDPTGPHPYTSDFYYASNLQQTLPSGLTWNVYLTQNNGIGCNAIPLQSFST